MFTTTVVLLRFAFSWIVQFCTGFPVPSFSTPEIFTAIFTPQKSPPEPNPSGRLPPQVFFSVLWRN
ncbi:hypothetical protein [Escherichia coli]|uniref:hypothetical protein n=1 Tax=Escherichia coli TaxID=562 RepID=UPI0025A02D09|nr:hypothetical protein [Escherichia coli]